MGAHALLKYGRPVLDLSGKWKKLTKLIFLFTLLTGSVKHSHSTKQPGSNTNHRPAVFWNVAGDKKG
jgi:predicted solute-binding protein